MDNLVDRSGYVNINEKVDVSYFDEEHEEWSMRTSTIGDILDSVCDEYTILPSIQPTQKVATWIDNGLYEIGEMGTEYRYLKCSNCGHKIVKAPIERYLNFCENCGCKMS